MAEAVASVIEDGGMLLAEAGTGTGKTLAYLIPAILSRQRVLVSTGTKNLQEQIYFKDLPALQDTLGVPFTATLMKGRSNYLCLHRWEMYRDGGQANTPVHQVLLPVINDWVSQTTTGDRAELRELPEDLPLWKDIAADVDTCLGSECPRYGDCFVTLMRQRAAESDVVIVNHHLLCADASVRRGAYGEVIPSCPTLVVDEAHQLEDVATQYFGVAFSNYRVDDLLRTPNRCCVQGRPLRPASTKTSTAPSPASPIGPASSSRAFLRREISRTLPRRGSRRSHRRRHDARRGARRPRGDAGACAMVEPRHKSRSRPARGEAQRGRRRHPAPRRRAAQRSQVPASRRRSRLRATTSKREDAECSCARRRWTSRGSSATRCSIACARRS